MYLKVQSLCKGPNPFHKRDTKDETTCCMHCTGAWRNLFALPYYWHYYLQFPWIHKSSIWPTTFEIIRSIAWTLRRRWLNCLSGSNDNDRWWFETQNSMPVDALAPHLTVCLTCSTSLLCCVAPDVPLLLSIPAVLPLYSHKYIYINTPWSSSTTS